MSTDELLQIRYSLERALSGEPDDSQLDVWWTMLRRGVASTDDMTWVEIGMATLYGMDPYRNSLVGESPFDVADAHSADVAYYYQHVFNARGELLADVVELFEWPPTARCSWMTCGSTQSSDAGATGASWSRTRSSRSQRTAPLCSPIRGRPTSDPTARTRSVASVPRQRTRASSERWASRPSVTACGRWT